MSVVELSNRGFDEQTCALACAGTLQESCQVFLERLLELTSRVITNSVAISITVISDDGGYQTAAATSPAAERIDALQYELREGPCVDALQTGRQHHLRGVEEPERWAAFRARARAHGFHTVLSVPLVAAEATVGALNVFAEDPDGLPDTDLFLAERLAASAAGTLASARAYRQAVQLNEQLQQALESRAVIEQAKGVLATLEHITVDAAFERMRQTSQRTNVKLRELAARIVDQATSAQRSA